MSSSLSTRCERSVEDSAPAPNRPVYKWPRRPELVAFTDPDQSGCEWRAPAYGARRFVHGEEADDDDEDCGRTDNRSDPRCGNPPAGLCIGRFCQEEQVLVKTYCADCHAIGTEGEAAKGTVVANVCPHTAGGSSPLGQDRHRGVVCVQALGGHHAIGNQIMERFERHGGRTDLSRTDLNGAAPACG